MHRIAILNRGEPALRFLRALREYNIEHSTQMVGVAFFTEPDRHAPFVRFADVSVFLGEPMRQTESGASISTYCDHDFVIQQLVKNKCDAVWPGWGFVSEDAGFVGKLEKEGILFIGPSSDAMYRLGDKIASKYMAEACLVPLASWAEVDDDDEQHSIFKQASRIGYPLMVKASAGGGGRGIIKVNREEELLSALYKVREAVAKVFGQGGILMEACVTNARHVEVQFVVNTLGRAFSLGVRDCSIQRKNQKVIEETPSPILPSEIEDELCRVTARLAQHAGYVGVGTAEYLYHPKNKVCTFLEVNSRLQVEHTITELVTG
ncbi:MAG: biotin carboxylase N-terminal domain-containing protein, partial [Myxococcota bacterium]|nr:biotin carboxylase N-terminal domain-containing protein [Myxococcota bacterium]